ncbi:MAG: hypothetical protein ACI3XJ_12625 [Oscillospiraceae bacterium]
MSLEDELARWAKTPAGKAKLKEAQKTAVKNGGRWRSGGKGPDFYAEEFIRILSAEMSLAGFEYGNYLYWTDMGYNDAAGKYEIHVNFKHEELHRDSLFPGDENHEGYPNGVDNIVALMNRGYHAKNYVYGTMPDGRRGRSLKDRPGEFFIQSAVEKFNSLYGLNAIADYGDDYSGGMNISWD